MDRVCILAKSPAETVKYLKRHAQKILTP
jgi:hypothetical protein